MSRKRTIPTVAEVRKHVASVLAGLPSHNKTVVLVCSYIMGSMRYTMVEMGKMQLSDFTDLGKLGFMIGFKDMQKARVAQETQKAADITNRALRDAKGSDDAN